MANYDMPPDMADFVEGCESVAMDAFDPATFEGDPSAAFSDTMSAVMDYMGECGMPTEMMSQFEDLATGCFDSYMGDNPNAAPMECFDAVGAGIDHQMADMAPDMNCADMAMDFPALPTDFGEFMNECPPYGNFAGGENYDATAHPYEGDMPGDPTFANAPDTSDPLAGDSAIDPATGMAPQPPEGPGEGGYDDGPAPMSYPEEGGQPADPLFGENAPGQDMGQPPAGDAMAEHGPGEPPQPMGPDGGQPDPAMDQMAADMDAEAGMTSPDVPPADPGPMPTPGITDDMPPPTEDDPSDAGGA